MYRSGRGIKEDNDGCVLGGEGTGLYVITMNGLIEAGLRKE